MIRRIARKIRNILRRSLHLYRERAIRKRLIMHTVLERIQGQAEPRSPKRLCLMAHFDETGRIHDYVQHYISHLYDLGFDVVLSSTSPSLYGHDVELIRPKCRLILRRENLGLDFASWKAALNEIPDLNSYEELLICNDSVLGPLRDLNPLFQKFRNSPLSIGGLTDCWIKRYHLQSYFLFFKREAFLSQVFRDFWDRVHLTFNKELIIERFEIGLSQHFLAHGFKLFVAFPYEEVRDKALANGKRSFQYWDLARLHPVNPSIFMWDVLLQDFDFPFIKGELLKFNKCSSLTAFRWRHMVPEAFPHVRDMIADYLKRGQRNSVG